MGSVTVDSVQYNRDLYKRYAEKILGSLYTFTRLTGDLATGRQTKEMIMKQHALSSKDAEALVRMLLDHGDIRLGDNLGFQVINVPMDAIVRELYEKDPVRTQDRVDGEITTPYEEAVQYYPEHISNIKAAAALVKHDLDRKNNR